MSIRSSLMFRRAVGVTLQQSVGNDDSIIKAMLVSTQGTESVDAEASQGRINFLMKNRHGTPFEHGSMTFLIEAPIFVFREFHRHRIGWSYNEVSGRYKELDPIFYIPHHDRPLVQQGKPGHYEFMVGSGDQYTRLINRMKEAYAAAWDTYQFSLRDGVAKEVARMVLPVGIYSAMYATCNPRSMMALLSLRTKREGSKFPSYPQREIEMVAEKLESRFSTLYPLTYKSFCDNGRVAP